MFRLDPDPALLLESDERRQLRDILRQLLADTCGPEEVRAQTRSPRGHDQVLWERLAVEVGVHGLAVPEEYGGAGYTFAELAVALDETGRVLCPAPLLSTVVLAGHALLDSGDRQACARWLPGIASGALTATVAGLPHRADVIAECGPGGWVLRGEADFVLDGEGADLLLVAARAPGGERLFACEPDTATVDRVARRVLDPTRRQALIRFRGAPCEPVGEAGQAPGTVGAVLDSGRVALAAEHVGGSAHALDAVLAYISSRTQFGRVIGSFQAVKHRLADLLVEVEGARSASAYASACLAGRTEEAPVAASVAAVACTGAYRLAAAEYVQLNGGIGFTWEHPAHLYVRRARADEALFGTADDHRLRLAGLLDLVGRSG
ncbi:acyl-CoA dehydrogenase family protein [Streptomyces turgidiscabies]|uniref:Acyl-CoA dehydrogenase, C-terminal domain protein n=1 Tax=Streptomyces turgidiscabies (strain Car8) TaxID=698760 RepID=L7EXQ7_STRT8|nr:MULTISPECIES: acyl-CoA dehydrogenase family protein [Streptomyces]ELP63486.1 acyl-CoA dehydrogenase, C-terminal domain protein [Streptomyces turgidiscabies Car8]MDX3496252.1 acyl-CoA/acyl-ACP dehydrogenase [Streptomyces turgidiscabies]GAQ75252.1 acyl-CoA dehydrogenase [Streptomyces turgidiscabies]